MEDQSKYNNRVEEAVALFKEGFNCSQSVVAPFADIHGLDREMALKVASSFGGGIGRMRETCGAACGLFILAGLETGSTSANNSNGKAANYSLVQELATKFKAENGSLNCAELLGLNKDKCNSSEVIDPHKSTCSKRPCSMMVKSAANLWANYLVSRDK